MKVCIVIPVYNEAKTIGGLVAQLRLKWLDMVVIDDGSTDHSGEIAKEMGAHVITIDHRRGKGYALRQGFEYALNNNFDAVITMDGDGQHSIEDIDIMIAKAQEVKADLILGDRMQNSRGMPWVRLATNQIMSSLISILCKQKVSDTQCGFRLMTADFLRKVKLASNDFQIESEIIVEANRFNCKIDSIPIRTIYSDEQSRIHPVKDTIRFVRYFWKELIK